MQTAPGLGPLLARNGLKSRTLKLLHHIGRLPHAVKVDRRWRVYLRLGRVSNLPTVWTNCLAGLILAGAFPTATDFMLLSASISLLYVSGMFLNDAFDQDFDRRYRPERPIPAGDISGPAVYKFGFGLMAAGLVALLVSAPRGEAAVWGIVLSLLIVFYDWRHKKIAASPVVIALCRVTVYFCAASTVGTAIDAKVMGGAGILMAYMIGLSYVAKQENLTEIQTLWPLILLTAPFLYVSHVLLRFDGQSILYVLFFIWVVYALTHLFKKPKSIPYAVVSLIAGISLLDGLLIASVGPQGFWSWFGIAGFVLTVAFQRYIPGT